MPSKEKTESGLPCEIRVVKYPTRMREFEFYKLQGWTWNPPPRNEQQERDFRKAESDFMRLSPSDPGFREAWNTYAFYMYGPEVEVTTAEIGVKNG